MRLVAGVLALILFAPLARAEDARTPEPAGSAERVARGDVARGDVARGDVAHGKVPLRIVRVMPESHQALLFDRARSTHVLAEVGGEIDGYTVEAIDDDEVTLRFEGKQIVLAAPVRRGYRRRDREISAVPVRPAVPGATQTDMTAGGPAPVDPYAEPPVRVVAAPGAASRGPAGSAARAIEAGEGGVRVAVAPGSTAVTSGSAAGDPTAGALAGQDGIRVVAAPVAATGGPPVSAARLAEARTPDPKPAEARPAEARPAEARPADARPAEAEAKPAEARPADVRTADTTAPDVRTTSVIRTASVASSEGVVLARVEVDAALADFARLAAALRGRFSADGLVVDDVKQGTIFQRAGLRAGDVVTSVDGAPLRSLDDAANLYARVSSTRAISAQVLRSGQPMTLRVAIQ